MASRDSRSILDRSFNATIALFAARGFHGTAQMLEEIHENTFGKVVEGFPRWSRRGVPISAVVLEALALELLLKVKLAQAGRPVPKSHDHSRLYADLPAAEREKAERQYQISGHQPMPVTLAEVLTESAEAFERRRYIHEQRRVRANPEDMRRAFEALSHGL